MSDYNRNAAIPGSYADRTSAIDAGLRAHMLRVYNYMAIGVGLTGLVAMLTYRLTGPALLQSPLMWVFMLAPLALVFFISSRINTLRSIIKDCWRDRCRKLAVWRFYVRPWLPLQGRRSRRLSLSG